MSRSLDDPPIFRLAGRDGARFDLVTEGPARAMLFVLEEDLVRLVVLPTGEFVFPSTWSIAPGLDDAPWEGRDRRDASGFSAPPCEVSTDEHGLTVQTRRLRVRLSWRNLRGRWEQRIEDRWVLVAEDRPTQAFDFGWWDGKVRHYLQRLPGEAYFGLGEVSGRLDRAGRRIRLSNRDALGYDAETSQPLYKHLPFHIARGAGKEGCAGLFYDTYADCTFDFGCERSNYHGLYRSFEADGGDLDLYVLAGPRPADVVRRFTWLTGRPARTPDWMLGYSGSGMTYADAADAPAQIDRFVQTCRAHDLGLESFHLSSGYAAHQGRRHVFRWDATRYPAPDAFLTRLAQDGVRVLANAKPCLMRDHPDFEEVARDGLFVREPDGRPHLVQFWGELGALIDFTNPRAVEWWKRQVTQELLDRGVAAVWNDNNEFEIASGRAEADIGGAGSPAAACKPLLSLLMMRASFEAQSARRPHEPAIGVSRAGAVGLHRYVQTWSGDNQTDWKTLRFNSRMGLGLSLSGVSNFGHDVGGFAGPAPDAELLVRWVAAAILLPRFSIHSWNDDGSTTEPWMHPSATAAIRRLLRLRRRLKPYLSACLRRYREAYEPVVRPLFYDFPRDEGAWADQDAFMVGSELLACPVFYPGVDGVSLRLPAGASWRDFWTGDTFSGGDVVERPCPWTRTPLFRRLATS